MSASCNKCVLFSEFSLSPEKLNLVPRGPIVLALYFSRHGGSRCAIYFLAKKIEAIRALLSRCIHTSAIDNLNVNFKKKRIMWVFSRDYNESNIILSLITGFNFANNKIIFLVLLITVLILLA